MSKYPRCVVCGRPLKSPESIARGMGSTCAGKGGGSVRRSSRRGKVLKGSYTSAPPVSPAKDNRPIAHGRDVERKPMLELRGKTGQLFFYFDGEWRTPDGARAGESDEWWIQKYFPNYWKESLAMKEGADE